MDKIITALLKKYDPDDKELFLKAKFVLFTTLFIICILFAVLVYTSYLTGMTTPVVRIEALGFFLMLLALGILLKGNYGLAIHAILIIGFTTTWAILFSEPSISLITKMDTIVFISGLLSAMPLMFFKNRRPMIFYFLANLIIFLFFNYYLSRVADLTALERMDYLLDNLTVMVFVFSVSFSLFTIYQQALNSLRKELKERKKAEKALLESENRLSTHLQNTPVGAISWDLDLRAIEWNPAAEAIFGYTREEAIGNHLTDLIVPQDMTQIVYNIFQALLSGRGGKRNINENQTKSGTRVLCDWYNTLLQDTDGHVIGIAALVNDITDQKRTQEMMIQSEKMMSIGGLAAGMAHEINNPLAGMMQNSQVVYNRLTKDLPANNKAAEAVGTSMAVIKNFVEKRGILRQLENIDKAGSQAAHIIKNMLSFARKGDSTRHEHDLKDLMDQTLALALNDYDPKKRCDFKQIEIIREYTRDCPSVLCEASKIQQVLFNIIKNASEAMWEETHEQKNPRLILRLYQNKEMACIEIEDNGPGMDDATRKRIFEPFFTTKAVDKGTGLGLSISYFIIVDDHGGEMGVESILGKGTNFKIKLPIRS